MGLLGVDIANVASRINKKITFLQPVYEAISNSLEAGATDIHVVFTTDDSVFDNMPKKINGFTIEDNGDGFTEKNRKAFTEYMTKNKLELGCKGVGRLTWIAVFKNIFIESFSDNEFTTIDFSLDFEEQKHIITKNLNPDKKRNRVTKIIFKNVTEKFKKIGKTNKQSIDGRADADFDKLYSVIERHLLVKLLLLKKKDVDFNISITLDERTETIKNNNIIETKELTFIIKDSDNNCHNFTLYYRFWPNNKKQVELWYCGNNRAVIQNKKDSYFSNLPDSNSVLMLLTSKYLDERVDDDRNGFAIPETSPEVGDPLSFLQISEAWQEENHKLLLEEYPEIKQANEQEITAAIEKAPYLTEYIKRDKSIIKNKNDLVKTAKKIFEEEKTSAQSNFISILKRKKINPDQFQNAINNISDIAFKELGEYISYRQAIIDALDASISDITKKEEFIHNIIMPQNTVSNKEDQGKHYLSNFWLLDDKFMTYYFSSSDKTIKKIVDNIYHREQQIYKKLNRPDISIFFNRDEQSSVKDAIIVELKGSNADTYEKAKALSELPNNIQIIRKNIPDIRSVWGYIITSIDEDFQETIENQGQYQELFVAEDSCKAYYTYNKAIKAHITIIDLKTIVTDSKARNKTFLDILKQP